MNTRNINRNRTIVGKSHCSGCGSSEHRINVCHKTNVEIQMLEKIGINSIALGHCVFGYEKRDVYTEFWLNTLTIKQIQILGYKWGHGNNLFKYKYTYVKDIIKMYDAKHMNEVNMLKKIIMDMEDYIIDIFLEDISKYNTVECMNEIIHRLKQYRTFIQFPIKVNNVKTVDFTNGRECPICLVEDISSSNLLGSDCGHVVCVSCFKQMALTERAKSHLNELIKCPMCRHEIDEITICDTNSNSIQKYCSTDLYDIKKMYIKKKEEENRIREAHRLREANDEANSLREREEMIVREREATERNAFSLKVIKFCEDVIYVLKWILLVLLVLVVIIITMK